MLWVASRRVQLRRRVSPPPALLGQINGPDGHSASSCFAPHHSGGAFYTLNRIARIRVSRERSNLPACLPARRSPARSLQPSTSFPLCTYCMHGASGRAGQAGQAGQGRPQPLPRAQLFIPPRPVVSIQAHTQFGAPCSRGHFLHRCSGRPATGPPPPSFNLPRASLRKGGAGESEKKPEEETRSDEKTIITIFYF